MSGWTRPARRPRTGWPWPAADGDRPVEAPARQDRVKAASDALAREALNVDKLSLELTVALLRLEEAWLRVDQASNGAWQAQARAAIAQAQARAGQGPTGP